MREKRNYEKKLEVWKTSENKGKGVKGKKEEFLGR